MHRHFSHKSTLLLARAAIATMLCMAGSLAFSFPANAGVRTSAEAHASIGQQATGVHRSTLPSMFRKGLVYIKTSVNKHKDVWMVLDTGTTDSMIDSDYARTIGIKLVRKSEGAQGFGTMAPTTYATGSVHLRVGKVPERAVLFESIRLGGMTGPDGMPVAGLLGHSFLEGKSIVIDYKREAVYFERMPQLADDRDMAMTLKNGIPIIQLKIAGQSVNALIDTGGTYSMIITPDTAKKLGIERLMTDAKPAVTVGHGGDQHILIGKAPPFAIGDRAVDDLSAAYTTFGTANETIGAGVSIGIGLLKTYKLTLNYVANTVRFEP